MTTSYNPFSLEGKTILVTGASSGIGKATAIECAKMGATLIITGRNEERLKDTFDKLEGTERAHQAIDIDLAEDENILRFVELLPKLDGVVFAAGIAKTWPVAFATKENFSEIFSTNFFSPIEILRLIVKKKLYNKPMSVVAISSISANEKISPAHGVYGTSKAALETYFKYEALELAPKKIRLNLVSPGMVNTPMTAPNVISENQLQEDLLKYPLGRYGEAEEIAYACIYFLSDASAWTTGSDLRIDGGISLK